MKKALLIGIPVLLLGAGGGVTYYLAIRSIINIPNVTPKKVKPVAQSPDPKNSIPWLLAAPLIQVAKDAKKIDEDAKAAAKKALSKPKPKVALEPPTAGQKKLAAIWDSMPPAKLAEMAKTWKPASLAQVLVMMDEEKVAKLLGTLDPAVASQISLAMQALVNRQATASSTRSGSSGA